MNSFGVYNRNQCYSALCINEVLSKQQNTLQVISFIYNGRISFHYMRCSGSYNIIQIHRSYMYTNMSDVKIL